VWISNEVDRDSYRMCHIPIIHVSLSLVEMMLTKLGARRYLLPRGLNLHDFEVRFKIVVASKRTTIYPKIEKYPFAPSLLWIIARSIPSGGVANAFVRQRLTRRAELAGNICNQRR
jgi:hypothetical protein